ncbi:MAG: PTS glucose transporter subunit IIA [Lachnospiraceae bacterium]|nr:PTS glucose transporter subunit IIA [Lachnospiraceae bacterium]
MLSITVFLGYYFFCIIVADAVVTTVMDTKHALGLTTDDGADILIHVGLDIVKLNGAPFTLRFW